MRNNGWLETYFIECSGDVGGENVSWEQQCTWRRRKMRDSAKVLVLLINVWCVQEKTREPIWFNRRSQRDGRDWIEWLTERQVF